jgi:hypothetical protein
VNIRIRTIALALCGALALGAAIASHVSDYKKTG